MESKKMCNTNGYKSGGKAQSAQPAKPKMCFLLRTKGNVLRGYYFWVYALSRRFNRASHHALQGVVKQQQLRTLFRWKHAAPKLFERIKTDTEQFFADPAFKEKLNLMKLDLILRSSNSHKGLFKDELCKHIPRCSTSSTFWRITISDL